VLELRRLRYFLVVADELSFTRASRKLAIAQPPLSRQIQRLEEELGVRLLDRTTRNLRLTEAGHFFKERMTGILRTTDSVVKTTRQIAGGGRCIDVGIATCSLYDQIAGFVQIFGAQTMEAAVKTVFQDSVALQLEGLRTREIHIGFSCQSVQDDVIASELLLEEPLLIAASACHPGVDDAFIGLRIFRETPLILYSREDLLRYDERIAVCFAKRQPVVHLHARNVREALQMAGKGIGFTLVPESFSGLPIEGVVYRSIPGARMSVQVFINYRKHDRSPAVASLRDFIRKKFEVGITINS